MWAPSISHFPISDDEKNKMLPEAESINKDGSQDGLMEAANIPLQSKEEDQMWKILKTDERYHLLHKLIIFNFIVFDLWN